MDRLSTLYRVIDAVNRHVGRTVAWLALGMVLVQFFVVVARYVFSIGSIFVQESIWYMHGTLFMVGAGFTLLRDGHVRVDVFYREARPRTKAVIDLAGSLVFLLAVCIFTLYMSWSYVLSSWAVLEGSTETSGIPAIFLLKTVIWVGIGLLGLQAISMAAKSVLILMGAPEPEPEPID